MTPFDADQIPPRTAEGCLSDLSLDRLLAGELDGTAAGARATAHLGTCRECTGRVSAIESEARRFPQEIWVQGLAAKAKRAAAETGSRIAGSGRREAGPVTRMLRTASGVALAAGIAAVAIFVQPPRTEPDGRVKGEGLTVYVRHTDGRVDEVLPGSRLAPGDSIRFEVSSAREGYLAVFGVDSTPAVTTYVPASGNAPLLLGRGSKQLLEGSIVLDDSSGAERVVAFLCRERMAVSALADAARAALAAANGDPGALGAIDVPGCRAHGVTFSKENGAP